MPTTPSPKLTLVQSLSWIVGSTLVISGVAHAFFTSYFQNNTSAEQLRAATLTSIIQTGPQKEALHSEYLAQLMGLSRDRPQLAARFDPKHAEKTLLSSPLVQEAHVKVIKPSSVYVDYTVRQPLAWLYDYENVALDKEGYLIPMHPFFPPKNLPEVYLGLAPFGERPPVPYLPLAAWGRPLEGPAIGLALDILARLQMPGRDLFRIKRIDVSKAFEASLGQREVVVLIENEIFSTAATDPFVAIHYLRLTSKNYPQELGNYLELRKKMLEEDRERIPSLQNGAALPPKIIDLRIPQLAYID